MEVIRIYENLWRITEGIDDFSVDAYVITGEKRALLIDSLMSETGLYDKIREITDLPLTVALTHGHVDHAGKALNKLNGICDIYMSHKDIQELDEELKGIDYIDLKPGQIFDLGGCILETISIPGHTAGSMVFFEPYKKWLFSGDGIGSGRLWLQLPRSLALSIFEDGLSKLMLRIQQLSRGGYTSSASYTSYASFTSFTSFTSFIEGTDGLLVFPGHSVQAPKQLDAMYIKDIAIITERLLAGVWEGEDAHIEFMGLDMNFKHISYNAVVEYCYDPGNMYSKRKDPAIEAVKDLFTEESFAEGGGLLRYMLYSPEIEPGQDYPLVVYLHGAGERGDNNTRHSLANSGATTLAASAWQSRHRCFIIAPQCPTDLYWPHESQIKLIVSLIRSLMSRLPINAARVYVTGLSMGGMGTWELIGRYPELFAAALPVCGAGDPELVKRAKNVPIWAFHAADDPVVPVSGRLPGELLPLELYGTRSLVYAIRAAGGNARYTEYAPGYMESAHGVHPHASWVAAYADTAALEWMFSQSRNDVYETYWIKPGCWRVTDYRGGAFYIVEGTEKALVIDTGMGGGNIAEHILRLTRLPLILAATHAHPDHIYHAHEFEKMYMSQKDRPTLDYFEGFKKERPGAYAAAQKAEDVRGGSIIDLGGGVEIEVLEIAGHTPGSVAYLDRRHGCCFAGDAIGSGAGVLLSATFSEYHESLISFYSKIELEDGLAFMCGHPRQERGLPYGSDFNPITKQTVADMIALCGELCRDGIKITLSPDADSFFFGTALEAALGTAKIKFSKSRLNTASE